jgi:TatD DNase family protein
MLIDTHAHLNMPVFDNDLDAVITRAKTAGVGIIINPSFSTEASIRSVSLVERYDCIYAAVGIHPHDAQKVTEGDISKIRELAGKPKVVAIGETGLDYYRNLSPKEKQQDLFRKFIVLAQELDLPLIIHTRDSLEDTLSILKENGNHKFKGVFHCFPGDMRDAEKVMELGFILSFTGVVTFKRAEKVRSLIKQLPLNQFMLETDCPYMAPEPHRGERCEPANVSLIASKIAEIKGISYEEVCDGTTKNAKKLFNI